jgi:uncharacterized protein (TIGR02001 family)
VRIVPSLLAVVALATAVSVRAQAPAPNLSGYVTAASGYWKHGLGQNDGAALTLGIDYEHHTGFFTHARATNVDFGSAYGYSRDVEASAHGGYHDRRAGWSWTASIGRYFYPGTHGNYDYDEISVSVGLRDRVFYAVSLSDDYYGGSSSALNQELSLIVPLRGDFEFGVALGSFGLGDSGPDITHWNVGVSKLVGRLAVDLRYYEGNYERRSILGDPYAEHYVLSASYAVRARGPR